MAARPPDRDIARVVGNSHWPMTRRLTLAHDEETRRRLPRVPPDAVHGRLLGGALGVDPRVEVFLGDDDAAAKAKVLGPSPRLRQVCAHPYRRNAS
jgi:hypothetical protein